MSSAATNGTPPLFYYVTGVDFKKPTAIVTRSGVFSSSGTVICQFGI